MNLPQIATTFRHMAAPTLRRSNHLKDTFSTHHPLLRTRCKTTAAEAKDAPKQATAAAAPKPASSESSVPIGTTLAAMSLAIVTVSTVAAITENATASSCPKFDPKEERFDQSTFVGRLSKMLLACDPYLLICSHEEVMRCKDLVERYETIYQEREEGVEEVVLNRKLWEAQVSTYT